MVPWDPRDAPLDSLNDDTKILTETDTETFFRYQIFRNRYRDFLSDTKFSETDTETFFPIPNFPKPIPRLFFRYQIFRNRNFFPRPNFFRNRYRYFFSETKNSETETETSFPIPNFPKPKPIPFFRYQIFRNRNRNHQKFGKSLETETQSVT